jgi:hypothetical protein
LGVLELFLYFVIEIVECCIIFIIRVEERSILFGGNLNSSLKHFRFAGLEDADLLLPADEEDGFGRGHRLRADHCYHLPVFHQLGRLLGKEVYSQGKRFSTG